MPFLQGSGSDLYERVSIRTLSVPENHWCLQTKSVLHNVMPFFKCISTSVLSQYQRVSSQSTTHAAAREKLSSAIIPYSTVPFHKEVY
jgi:hypothetical protein